MLHAISLGTAVPRSGSLGRVRAAGPRAVNIATSAGTVSIVRYAEDMTIAAAASPDLWANGNPLPAAFGPASGSCWFADSLDLTLNGRRLELQLPAAADFDGRIAPLRMSQVALRQLARTLAERLACVGRAGGMLRLVDPGAEVDPLLRTTAEALAAHSAASSEAALRQLGGMVGCGIGLTPSVDDFIVGVLAADAAISVAATPAPTPPPSLERLRAAVAAHLTDTTEMGRSLLAAALRGSFPAYLCRCLQAAPAALSGDDEGAAQFTAAICAAVHHGYSSGTDALAGVAWRWQQRSNEL